VRRENSLYNNNMATDFKISEQRLWQCRKTNDRDGNPSHRKDHLFIKD
jgi:hypothetical protein